MRELVEWGEALEESVDRQSLTVMTGVDDLRQQTARFRGCLVELRCRYNLVECLVTAGGAAEGGDRRYDVEGAEKLLSLWNNFTEKLSARVQRMEWVEGSWADFDAQTADMETWCLHQSDRLAAFQRSAHEFSVAHCLREARLVGEQVRTKSEALVALRQEFGSTLAAERAVNIDQAAFRVKLTYLEEQYANLTVEAQQAIGKLETIASLWTAYNKQLLSTTNLLAETEYVLEGHVQAKADFQSFQVTVARLHEIHQQYEATGSAALLQFGETGARLGQLCEASVRHGLANTRNDLERRWPRTRRRSPTARRPWSGTRPP